MHENLMNRSSCDLIRATKALDSYFLLLACRCPIYGQRYIIKVGTWTQKYEDFKCYFPSQLCRKMVTKPAFSQFLFSMSSYKTITNRKWLWKLHNFRNVYLSNKVICYIIIQQMFRMWQRVYFATNIFVWEHESL